MQVNDSATCSVDRVLQYERIFSTWSAKSMLKSVSDSMDVDRAYDKGIDAGCHAVGFQVIFEASRSPKRLCCFYVFLSVHCGYVHFLSLLSGKRR